jgi:hypothetical protein
MPYRTLLALVFIVAGAGPLALPPGVEAASAKRQCIREQCNRQREDCRKGYASQFKQAEAACNALTGGDKKRCKKAAKKAAKEHQKACKTDAFKACKACCGTDQIAQCSVQVCGDGVRVSGEECDAGAENSDTVPNACRTSCRAASCGDGIIDPELGEQCEPGQPHCSASCLTQFACPRLRFTTGLPGGTCGRINDAADGSGADLVPGGAGSASLECGSLYVGGGGSLQPPSETPDGGSAVINVSDCSDETALVLAPASEADTGSDETCTAPGCLFGPPLPVLNPTIPTLSTCVINTIADEPPVGGTLDAATGEATVNLPLAGTIYLTGDLDPSTPEPQPCPLCVDGTCNSGANAGRSCTTTTSEPSHDCPPPGAPLATFLADLSPLTTGTAIRSDAEGNFCDTTQAVPGAFGRRTARYIEANGMPAGALSIPGNSPDDPLPEPEPVVLAAVICIQATGVGLVDGFVSWPGPGAITLVGEAVLEPVERMTTTTTTTVATPTTSSSTTSTTLPQPVDACSLAGTISTLPFAAMRDTSGAGISADDPLLTCGDAGTRQGHSVWYVVTAPADGTITADTAGSSYDTVLAAFTGSCSSLTEVACNDDATGSQSRITFAVTAGSNYLLEATSFGRTPADTLALNVQFDSPTCGDGTLNVPGEDCDGTDDDACPGQCRPECSCPSPSCGDDEVNHPREECDGTDDSACRGLCGIDCRCAGPSDTCGLAVEISAFPFTDRHDTNSATVSADDPRLSCGDAGTQQGHSLWYVLTAPEDGTITADTSGSDYDTVLGVLTGTCGTLSEIACNDDFDILRGESRVSFSVRRGGEYFLEVTSFGSEPGGPLAITVTFTVESCGDDRINRPGENCDGADDDACPGRCRSDCSCPPPTCGDDTVSSSGEACDGTDDGACPGRCSVDCRCAGPVDACTSAASVSALPFTDTRDTTDTTVSEDDPSLSCGEGGQQAHSVWYQVTAPGDGTMTANTFGSAYDTVLAALRGSCGDLSEVGCNDDVDFDNGNLQSEISFAVTAGTRYLLEVTSFGTERGGALILNVMFLEGSPSRAFLAGAAGLFD